MPEPTTATVWVPEIATSVDHANALPARTLILTGWLSQTWTRLAAPDDRDDFTEQDMPLHALVPVTATVETTGEYHHPADGLGWRTLTRYTTPWTPEEEA